jgi:outer membrane protein TolC
MSARRIARIALALALLAAPRVAWAQAAPARLTLAQALELAERSNPAYRRSTNDLELNSIESREAWLGILPRPQISVLNTSMSWNLQRVGTDPFGNPLPNPEAQMVQSSTSSQNAALNLTMDFRNYLAFKNRGAQGELREMGADNQLRALQADVRRSFLTAQLRQLTVELEAQLLETQRKNQEVAELLFGLARSERIDVLEARLAVATQEEVLRQARADLIAALLVLRNLIGDSELHIGEVEPVSFRELDPATLDEEALVRTALLSSPTLLQQTAQIDITARQVSLTRAQRWLPTLGFALTTGRSELERGGGGAFLQPNPSGGWDRTVSVNLRFPDLGSYFQFENMSDRQMVSVRNAEETLRERRLAVEQEVRNTLVSLRSDHAAMGLQQQRVAIAEESLSLRMESYRLGRGTFQDLQNASQGVASAQRALLSGRFTREAALIALEQSLAMPLEQIAALRGN